MRSYGAAALGGALGALGRWALGRGLPAGPGDWPLATLLVNLTGCLAIGVLVAVLPAGSGARPWLRPFLVTGVLGGWTTWSAFAVDAVQLAEAGAWAVAAGYVVGSVAGGLLAVAAGLVGTRRALRARS